MHLPRTVLTTALLAALYVPAAHAEVAIDVIAGSEITFEGLIQADGNWFHNDVVDLNGSGNNGNNSEFELRRAELILKGKGPGNLDWVVGYDAKADKFLDTNVRYKFGGNGNTYLQAGQFKQPNSLEELSSTKNNDFISKATVTNTFALGRRLGAAYAVGDANWSVTASAFGRELTRNLAHGSGYALRGTFAPLMETGQVLHLGLNWADYDTDADTLRLRARPNADLATVRLVDSGELRDTDRMRTIGAELMYLRGPLKLQAEYFDASVKRYDHGDYSSSGYYLSGVWNLTGESWGYKGGVPSTGLPSEPASGQWQLAARFDHIDLNDGSVDTAAVVPVVDGVLGGKMDVWTVGVNWYWRSNFRTSLNYAMADSSKYSRSAGGFVDDKPSSVQARLQLFW